MHRRTVARATVLVTACLSFVTASAQSSQPVVLVAASGGHEVLFHDASTFARLGSVTVGAGPHEIAVSADGRRAFVADAGSPTTPGTTITVIDIASRRATRSLALPDGCKPHDLRVSRDGSRAWSTCAPAPRVVEIDTATGAVRQSWETGKDGGWMLIVTPDEQKIYVANLEGRSLSAIDRRTNRVATIALDGGAMGMDLSPDGRELWVGGFDADRVWIVDVAADRVTATIGSTFVRPGRIRFIPGRNQLLVQHGGNKLSVMDAKTRAVSATLELTHSAKCLAITRDGRRAYVGHPGANLVTVVDLDSMKPAGEFAAGPTPDGVVLAAR